jgi:Ca-activated chloride channel family protein
MIPILAYPWALLLLLLLPALAWLWLGRAHGAWRFSDARILPPLVGTRARWAHWGGLTLRLFGLCAAVVALSGPRWPDPQRVETEGIAIAMVLDVSVSMGEEDFAFGKTKTTRLLGVKKLFRLFVAGGQASDDAQLPGRPSDLIALVTFATHPETACPLTLDHAALLQIMEAQEPRTAAGEGTTNPGDAIAWALHVLEPAPTRRKVIVYLTDGEANVDLGDPKDPEDRKRNLKPLQAAHMAANLGVPIYAIDASPEPRTPQEAEEVEQARVRMQRIAKMTDGTYFRAQDASGLLRAYERIDRLERNRIVSFQYRRYHEGFAWLAGAALAAWLALIALEATAWRKTP